MSSRSMLAARLARVSEVILIALACLAPWAFGSVEAWAEFLLMLGLAALMVLRLATGWLTPAERRADLLSIPCAALMGLAVLGLVQLIPLPEGLLVRLGSTGETRARLAPRKTVRVLEDSAPVAPPASTLALEPEAARHGAMRLAAVGILFACAVGLKPSYRRLRWFGLAIVANATLLALFALVQAMTWDGKIYWTRPSPVANGWYTGGPFICHNHLAAYLNMGLGFALGSLLATLQKGSARGRRLGETTISLDRGRFLWFAYAVAVLLVGLIATHSRSGFLAMVAAVVVTFLVLRPRNVQLRVGLLCSLLIVPLFLFALGTDSPFQRMASIRDAGQSGLNGRTEIWNAALHAWRKNPILGAGLGSFEVAVAQTLDRDPGVIFQHAENEFLEILVEGGVVGLDLFLLLLGALCWGGFQALRHAETTQDRAMILGAAFAGLALLIQALADFPLHVSGVGVTAVILAGYLFALRGGREWVEVPALVPEQKVRWPARLADLALAAVCGLLLVSQFPLVQAEALLADTGLSMPGSSLPGAGAEALSRNDLERAQTRLRRALSLRPDWSLGHLQLGLVEQQLYRHAAAEQLEVDLAEPGALTTQAEEDQDDAKEQDRLMTDPLWLLGVVHAAEPGELEQNGGVLSHEPVRNHLLPAARAFLEARRCSPFRAAPHAYLATVDYLIAAGEPARVLLERTLELARANAQILELAGVAAVRVGALDLAAQCWRGVLAVQWTDWRNIADLASAVLTPDQILNDVLPPGDHFEIWFADHNYNDPENQEIRTRFLRAALERVPNNARLEPAQRLWIQGQALARLDERERARTLMQQALGLELRQTNWRLELVRWLLEWEMVKEAHTQARIGLELEPYNPSFQNALRTTQDALAKGKSPRAAESSSATSSGPDRDGLAARPRSRP